MRSMFGMMKGRRTVDAENLFWYLHNKTSEDPTSCWIPPVGRRNRAGYVQINVQGRSVLAHRLSLAWDMGLDSDLDLPGQFTVDHVRDWGCTTTSCVNPRHLQLVTPLENSRRVANERVVEPPKWAAGEVTRSVPASDRVRSRGDFLRPKRGVFAQRNILDVVAETFPERRRTKTGRMALIDIERDTGIGRDEIREALAKEGVGAVRASVRILSRGPTPTTVLTIRWAALDEARRVRACTRPQEGVDLRK